MTSEYIPLYLKDYSFDYYFRSGGMESGSTMSWTSLDPLLNFNTSGNDLYPTRDTNESSLPGPGGTQVDMSAFERFNRRVNDSAFFCLVAAYCALIIFGTLGNSLVVFVVARQPAMRTARNVFVVNLAISDLLLCLITMPLTVNHLYIYI